MSESFEQVGKQKPFTQVYDNVPKLACKFIDNDTTAPKLHHKNRMLKYVDELIREIYLRRLGRETFIRNVDAPKLIFL